MLMWPSLLRGYADCKTSFWMAAMAAPYIQYQGTSQGFFYDPATMEPLVNNSAMARVLEMYKELGLYSHPSTANGCYAASPLFTQGKCVLTVNWGDEFKVRALISPLEPSAGGFHSLVVPVNVSAQPAFHCDPTVCRIKHSPEPGKRGVDAAPTASTMAIALGGEVGCHEVGTVHQMLSEVAPGKQAAPSKQDASSTNPQSVWAQRMPVLAMTVRQCQAQKLHI
jgi:hypothetical protein